MGTRGLLFICWKGRYYVYYNHYDSYPEGLGETIVDKIPATPEEFQEWLQKMRRTYSRLSDQLEEQILPVCPDFLQAGGISSHKERYFRSYLALDDRLEQLPSRAMKDWIRDTWIEWTYTTDLDRELFIVDQSVFFELIKLPHYADWHKYLVKDSSGRRVLASSTPSDLIGNPSMNIGIEREIGVNADLRARYHSFDCTIDLSKNTIESEPHNSSRVTLLVATILGICREYRDILDSSYMYWVSASFPFQEIAFAILSAAAGEMAFVSPKSLDGRYSHEGFFRIPGKDIQNDSHTLLPKFLSECHTPSIRPGSAPRDNPFWVGSVLVYLTPRLDLIAVEEASIAAVVDSDLAHGYRLFYAIDFSILDFVLIDVTKGNDGLVQIERTPLIDLIYFDDDTSRFPRGPRSRNSEPPSMENTAEHEEGGVEESGGENNTDRNEASDEECDASAASEGEDANLGNKLVALLLIQSFDSAMDEHLEGSKSRTLPNEILTTIIEHADHQTYLSLAMASACCRDLYYRKFRLNDDYAIIDQGTELSMSTSMTLEDLETGDRILTSLSLDRGKGPLYIELDNDDATGSESVALKMNPVVGMTESKRRSILNALRFCFANVSLKRPSYPITKKDMPSCKSFSYLYHPNGPEPERLFKLADYSYLGSLKDAFGRYILGIME
ncbi:hypothetical protein BJX64DRAFT_89178 [Aspergillus heterothallicus]